jgi:hypothetical protein
MYEILDTLFGLQVEVGSFFKNGHGVVVLKVDESNDEESVKPLGSVLFWRMKQQSNKDSRDVSK